MTDLARLREGRFLVIGRAGLDLMPDPPGSAIETAERFVPALGGSAANIATALTRQGCEAALVTRVSNDAVGRYCLGQLDRYGIDRRHVRLAGGEARTSLALSESRVEAHQTVIYRNGAADFALTAEDLAEVHWPDCSALVATGTALAAEPSRGAVLGALARARAEGIPVVLDLDYRPYSWASPGEAAEVCARAAALSNIVVGNDGEFALLAGPEGGEAQARGLAAQGAAIVVYKMGEAGAVTFAGGEALRSGIYRVPALKPTGAGDAFLGAFLAGLAAGRTVAEAVLRGSAAAAIVVGRVGCAPAMPTPRELDAFLAAHPGPTIP
jgi:5-dehydro-2-deoxygluconokinase